MIGWKSSNPLKSQRGIIPPDTENLEKCFEPLESRPSRRHPSMCTSAPNARTYLACALSAKTLFHLIQTPDPTVVCIVSCTAGEGGSIGAVAKKKAHRKEGTWTFAMHSQNKTRDIFLPDCLVSSLHDRMDGWESEDGSDEKLDALFLRSRFDGTSCKSDVNSP